MFAQIFEITLMNLRNLPARIGSSSVIVVGIAGVVAVLIGVLSMAAGFTAALEGSSMPGRAIVLRDGSNNELSSGISVEEFNILARMEGVKLASDELYVVADVPKRDTGTPANLVIRGMRQAGIDVRPEMHLVQGRLFEAGKGEIIVGVKAASEFAGLSLGDVVEFRESGWTVVGTFTTGGSAYESEVWADLPVAQTSFRRGGTLSSARVLLEDPSAAVSVNERIQADPRLDIALTTEEEFFAGQSEDRSELINTFGYAVAAIMAIGAVFAALNTMYSAVSARTVEIATLRALGFSNVPVVVSVMIEAIFLALVGGLVGGILVYLLFDGYTASTLNNASFSQVAFDFAVTGELMMLGIAWALGLGLVGGLFPAVRAARLPITVALRGE
ncbi:MAG: FtsX-like permease family protein [Pseudomonadales bacterium]|nr:FtsX-like permease family protein [Pseudomonadales bacterium]